MAKITIMIVLSVYGMAIGIAHVPQSIYLADGSIAENIAGASQRD